MAEFTTNHIVGAEAKIQASTFDTEDPCVYFRYPVGLEKVQLTFVGLVKMLVAANRVRRYTCRLALVA
jgi:hypothetical protein